VRPAPWTLEDFLPRLDDWEAQEHPLDELRVRVLDWIFTRAENPYADARRVAGFADYWQAVIPSSAHFDDHAERCAVVCLYWVDAGASRVRCDRIASLSLPIE
jgi:hypothetical protein